MVGIKVRAADFSVQPLVHDPAVVSGAILSKLGIITVIKVHLDCHEQGNLVTVLFFCDLDGVPSLINFFVCLRQRIFMTQRVLRPNAAGKIDRIRIKEESP